jgi:hypothetical protein
MAKKGNVNQIFLLWPKKENANQNYLKKIFLKML